MQRPSPSHDQGSASTPATVSAAEVFCGESGLTEEALTKDWKAVPIPGPEDTEGARRLAHELAGWMAIPVPKGSTEEMLENPLGKGVGGVLKQFVRVHPEAAMQALREALQVQRDENKRSVPTILPAVMNVVAQDKVFRPLLHAAIQQPKE